MKIALIQFNAGNNKEKNIARALQLVKQAARKQAKFILLPEVFIYRGERSELVRVSEAISGPVIKAIAKAAKEYKTHILAGSIYEKITGNKKVYNTSVLINNQGKIIERYRKINMFDAVLGKTRIKEGDVFKEGKKVVSADVENFKVGLSICYDLRFPEIYRKYALNGVQVLCVPSAFTHKTGKDHWHTLLRARAIENLSYVLAPNQVGVDHRGVKSYGHSLVVDPWGKIIAEGTANKEQIIYASLDKKFLLNKRKQLPALNKLLT